VQFSEKSRLLKLQKISKRSRRARIQGSALEKIIDEVIAQNPTQVADYKSGKDKLFAFFVGQVMKVSKGKANPEQVTELLKKKL
jgi:aspartyl-tRNA(Asn)/glutamyl-tRNA(Gln) amidotransferase subunit B